MPGSPASVHKVRNGKGARINPRHQEVLNLWLEDVGKSPVECWQAVYPKSAKATAAAGFGKLIMRPEAQFYIEERQRRLALMVDKSREDVAKELINVGFARIDDVVRWDEEGNMSFTATENLSPAQLASISSVKVRRTDYYGKEGDISHSVTNMEIKQHDKLRALQQFVTLMGFDPSAGTAGAVTNNVIVLPAVEDQEELLNRMKVVDVPASTED